MVAGFLKHIAFKPQACIPHSSKPIYHENPEEKKYLGLPGRRSHWTDSWSWLWGFQKEFHREIHVEKLHQNWKSMCIFQEGTGRKLLECYWLQFMEFFLVKFTWLFSPNAVVSMCIDTNDFKTISFLWIKALHQNWPMYHLCHDQELLFEAKGDYFICFSKSVVWIICSERKKICVFVIRFGCGGGINEGIVKAGCKCCTLQWITLCQDAMMQQFCAVIWNSLKSWAQIRQHACRKERFS